MCHVYNTGNDAMGSLLCIIHTHKKHKTKLDKNNCRIRLRVGLTLYNNDTNKRNDVWVTGKI